MKRLWFDTESVSFTGFTLLIQYQTEEMERDDIRIHNIFNSPVIDTLRLINSMMNYCMVGYNLSHDFYHLAQTFNVLREMPANELPEPTEYVDISRSLSSKNLCLKPAGAHHMVNLLIQ